MAKLLGRLMNGGKPTEEEMAMIKELDTDDDTTEGTLSKDEVKFIIILNY